MTVRLSPEHTRREPGSGKRQSGQVGSKGQKRDQWTPANFRLQIDGLDCTGVTKIEPVAVTAVVAEEPSGEYRDYEKSVGHLEVSDLVVTVSENKAATFHAWHDDFVIKGKNGSQYEKNGTLEYLSSNMQDVLLTLQLRNLGIFRLASAEATSSETIPRVTASMYCEEITLGTSIPPPKRNGGQGNGNGGQGNGNGGQGNGNGALIQTCG